VPADEQSDPATAATVPPDCTVTWWGHASVDVRMDGARVVTDPLLRSRVGPLHSVGHRPRSAGAGSPLADVDAVLLSHLHRDHTDLPSLRRFPRTRVLAPDGSGSVLHRSVDGPVEELAPWSGADVGRLRVTATTAVHDGRRNRRGPRQEAVGYLLQGSRTVYFAGDTELFPGMADLRGEHGIDVALLPVSGWGLTLGEGHMDEVAAAEAVELLRPRLAVPIHWGTLRVPAAWRTRRSHLLGVAARFADLVAARTPGTAVVVPVPGRPISVPAGPRRR
jgi:L-ascorbate metabolism protein UlaG (beta-lactamase superfamily)